MNPLPRESKFARPHRVKKEISPPALGMKPAQTDRLKLFPAIKISPPRGELYPLHGRKVQEIFQPYFPPPRGDEPDNALRARRYDRLFSPPRGDEPLNGRRIIRELAIFPTAWG